jgi:hypothetical protein
MTNQSTYSAEARRRVVDAAAGAFDLRHRERLALNREAVLANIAKQRPPPRQESECTARQRSLKMTWIVVLYGIGAMCAFTAMVLVLRISP